MRREGSYREGDVGTGVPGREHLCLPYSLNPKNFVNKTLLHHQSSLHHHNQPPPVLLTRNSLQNLIVFHKVVYSLLLVPSTLFKTVFSLIK